MVDDGSKDSTCEVVRNYCVQEGTERVRLLKLYRNHGKGGAVRKVSKPHATQARCDTDTRSLTHAHTHASPTPQGMLRGRGQYLLMVDADGATVASELGALEARLRATEQDGHGIAVGSRAHLQEQAVATVRPRACAAPLPLLLRATRGSLAARVTRGWARLRDDSASGTETFSCTGSTGW